MIDVRELKVSKNGRTICSVPELTVATGDRIAVYGENGSGKTTLLRVLAGMERDFEGESNVAVPTTDRIYVHQSPYLFRGSALFNVTYGLRGRKLAKAERERQGQHWLKQFGISGLANDRVGNLSGGEKRRIALARAFILQPELLLLDEPFADMDDDGIALVRQAIADATDCTIVIASPKRVPDGLVTGELKIERIA